MIGKRKRKLGVCSVCWVFQHVTDFESTVGLSLRMDVVFLLYSGSLFNYRAKNENNHKTLVI